MVLFKYLGIKWRWLPYAEMRREQETWFIDLRWLFFQLSIYSRDMAEKIVDTLNKYKEVSIPDRSI